MKILQVIPYFNPKRGGDVNACYQQARVLAQMNFDVTIITTDFEYDRDFAESLRKTGVQILHFPYEFEFHLFIKSRAMKKWVKNNINRFDIIYLQEFRSYQNILIHRYARKAKIPYVLQAHGSVPQFNKVVILKKLFDHLYGKRILKDANRLIAITEKEKQDYIKMGSMAGKIEIIPPGINFTDYEFLPKKDAFKKEYGIGEEKKIVLYLGRLHESKGVDLLIRAFARSSSTMPDIVLLIIGPDMGDKENLEHLAESLGIQERTRFLDFIDESVKKKALVDASVLVIPSYSGFPVTFLEACACGTPILTTTKGDNLNWIGDVGLISEFDDSALSDALATLLTDEKIVQKFSINGKELARKQFDWKILIERYLRLYEQCQKRFHLHLATNDSFFVFGYFGWRNPGDDAIGISSLKEIRKRFLKSRIFFISNEKYFANVFASSYGFFSVDFNPIQIIKAICSTNRTIILGGTHFHDSDEFIPRRMRIFGYFLIFTTISRLLGKSPILLGHGLGPISKEWSRLFLRLILWNSSLVAVRDVKSYELACSLGFKEKSLFGSDPAFLLLDNFKEQLHSENKGKIIGIEVTPVFRTYSRSNHIDQRIISSIGTAIKTILNRDENTEIRLFIFRTGNRHSDINMTQDIRSNILGYESRVKIIRYEGNLEELLRRISECNIIIGMRYHCLLFALALRKPLIAIIYHEKCRNLLKEFSSEENYILESNEITDNILVDMITKLMDRDNEVTESDVIKNAIYRIERMFDAIRM